MMQKIRRLARSPWLPFFVAALGVLLFYVFCTRLLVKTDDGHFLGILHNPGFTLAAWLEQRYRTISGRTINEAVMMTFLRSPLLLWKFAGAALFCIVVWFSCKLSLAFSGNIPAKSKISFACAASLLALPTCMSAGAFWFAGSFTYLWPTAALILCVMPLAFELLDIPHKPWLYVLSFFAAPLAASQEQAAAATLALLLCLNLFLILKKQWHIRAALPLVPAGVCTWLLLSSPGARLRNAAETKNSFPAFLDLSLPSKFLCGFSNYAAYAFFLSIPAMTVFLLSLYLKLRQDGQKNRRLTAIHGICWAVLCLGGNLLSFAAGRCIPDQWFERMFVSNQFYAAGIALLAACFVFFMSIIILLILLIRRQRTAGLSAGLCFAAAAGCGIAPGFSSSVYASGQRVFFFSEIFLLMAAAILFGNIEKTSKGTKILQTCAAVFSVGFSLFYLLGFRLLEIPPMG